MWINVAFKGHICCSYIYIAITWQVEVTYCCFSLYLYVQSYLEYSSSALGHLCAMLQEYFSGAYVNNVKCIYTCASGNTVDCIEFI